MTNHYICQICGGPILIMVNRYTGICSENCRKIAVSKEETKVSLSRNDRYKFLEKLEDQSIG